MRCCARGSTLAGYSQSGEAWDLQETGREAVLADRGYLTFSLPRGSALGLGKEGASLQSRLWSEVWDSTASPQPPYYKGTVASLRCREVAAAQWDSALCSAGKEGNTTKWIVPCAGFAVQWGQRLPRQHWGVGRQKMEYLRYCWSEELNRKTCREGCEMAGEHEDCWLWNLPKTGQNNFWQDGLPLSLPLHTELGCKQTVAQRILPKLLPITKLKV